MNEAEKEALFFRKILVDSRQFLAEICFLGRRRIVERAAIGRGEQREQSLRLS